jgi:hypothetical protein
MADRGRDIRLFQRAAAQRLKAAELLFDHGFFLESIYIGGYVVECALKALILKRTPQSRYQAVWKQITEVGSKGHDFEYLGGFLFSPDRTRRARIASPLVVPKTIRKSLRQVASWSTVLRYRVSLEKRDDAKTFLSAAKLIGEWAERS